MYKPYRKPIVTSSPDVKVPPPRISRFVIFLVSVLVRPYLILLFGSAKIVLSGEKTIFDVFRRTLSGESRCIIAFRHPDGREPQLLSWLFLFRLKKLAAKSGVRFKRRPHAIFIYGYEVVRWGGWTVRFFMPNLGAIPIHHTKLDSKGMAMINNAIVNGPYPVALAPEGQVSYSTDSVPRLETGSIRIGFQAARQLAQNNSNCKLEILPLSVHFRYGRSGERAMEKLLVKTEKLCGFLRRKDERLSFEQRLQRCRVYILEINEGRYCIKSDNSLSFELRLEKAVNAALETAERMLGIQGEGDFFPRLYRVRHECWDRIFLPGVVDLKKMQPLLRSVRDLGAGEAWHIARHQELADFGWYFCRPLPGEGSSLHNKVEYVQNLFDFANRTMGGAISGRVNIHPRKIIIRSGNPVDLCARLDEYRENKKDAVSSAACALEKEYLDCIEEVNRIEKG
jgi:hypothetical protein